jgi:predicted amidohydrolase YtcJ
MRFTAIPTLRFVLPQSRLVPLSGIIASILLLSGCGFQSMDVDCIVHNGTILTLDSDKPTAQALAIKDGKILEVGPDRQILNKYRAPHQVDLRGGVLTPGLMDAHAHLVGYADGLLEANLVGADSWEATVERAVQHAQSQPSEWVRGRGWDQNDWEVTNWPNRTLLDSLFPDVPVYLERIDGHAVIINGEALRRVGLKCGMDSGGGLILCDDNNEPTGVLIDEMVSEVLRFLPPHDSLLRTSALLDAQSTMLENGLTQITDAGLSAGEIQRLLKLEEQGLLKLRINAMVSGTDDDIAWLVENGPISTDRISVSSVKFYMDGALGSRGAMLLDPYSDLAGWHGLSTQDVAWFNEKLRLLHAKGLQAATHCIGDSAVRLVLDCYAQVLEGANDRRWRIEHAQVVSKKDMAQFGAHHVIPSIQPTHATSDMYWAGERLGRNRIRRAYAYKQLLEQLGMVALGTDFPVEDVDPRKTMHSATARKDAQGYPEGGFQMENALSPIQAMRGMTQWVALTQFQEESLGTIEAGKLADFTWMDRNWLTIDPEDVLTTKIKGTCIEGEWVYLNE